MKRWSLNVWNDWRHVRGGMLDLTVLRLNTDYLRGHYACVDVVILGLGLSLTRYSDPRGTRWRVADDVPVESLGREHGA